MSYDKAYNPAPRGQIRQSEKVCKHREKLVQEILDRQWSIENDLQVSAPPATSEKPIKGAYHFVGGRWKLRPV